MKQEMINKIVNAIKQNCVSDFEGYLQIHEVNLRRALASLPSVQVDKWISVEDRLPEELDVVWCYCIRSKDIFLGCRAYDGEGNWAWSKSNGIIYIENGEITSECEWDDLSVTHWQPLPAPPTDLPTQTQNVE